MGTTKHLIVDGSNVLQAWPELKALAKRDRNSARSRLIHQLAPIHDAGEIRVTLVFDGKGTDLAVESPLAVASFAVVTTSSAQTGDDVIEHLVANSADAAVCCVATDDNAERETVSALGAQVLTTSDLAAWCESAATRQKAVLQQRTKKNDRTWKAS